MKWADENKMEVAFDKTVEILFSRNSAEGGGKVHPNLTLPGKGWPRTVKAAKADLKGVELPEADAPKKPTDTVWKHAGGLYFVPAEGRLVLKGAATDAGPDAQAIASTCKGKVLMEVNGTKVRTEEDVKRIISQRTPNQIQLRFGVPVQYDTTPVFLGVTLDGTLSFQAHLDAVKKKMNSRLAVIRKLAGTSWGCNTADLRAVYVSHMCSQQQGTVARSTWRGHQTQRQGRWSQPMAERREDYLRVHVRHA